MGGCPDNDWQWLSRRKSSFQDAHYAWTSWYRSFTLHWQNSPACSEKSPARHWSMYSELDCLPIPKRCCVHLLILTTFRQNMCSAKQGSLWTMNRVAAVVNQSTKQKKCPHSSLKRTHCIVLIAPDPIIWLRTDSLNDQGSQSSDVTDAKICQNIQKTEKGVRYEHHSRLRENKHQPVSDAYVCVSTR